MWVYKKNSDIIYYIYKNGTVLKDDLSNGNLPTGYTKVKYLCDSGTQYIRTGYAHDSNAIFELTTTWNSLFRAGSQGSHYYFGSKNTDGDSIKLRTFSGGPRCVAFDLAKSDGWGWQWGMFNNPGGEAKIRCGNTIGMYVDNDKKVNPHNAASFDASEIYIFALNNADNDVVYTDKDIYFSIYTVIMDFRIFDENENLKLDFVPCLDKNNRPCMYDKVSHKSFYNQGSGEFGYELEDETYVAPQ